MATRSDFAQKLLGDLQLRKERMSTPSSHNAGNLKGMARDSYGNPSQNHKASRQTKSLQRVSSNSQQNSNFGSRSPSIEESSNQIVPYGKPQNSEKIGELSRALAFILENSGNSPSSNNNPIVSFFRRVGKRALDIGKIERRKSLHMGNKTSSQIITLSSFQIDEISKGARRLNQILMTCPNSVTFDGHSIEIGRELLKGATDLEESLRMLANLQQTSEKITNPRTKSRIKLLDEDEEEESEEKIISSNRKNNKLVELPRFSFDKPSRKSQGIKKQESSNLDVVFSHKRSASCPDFRPEKGKKSNVIAKLMGLEEIPQKEGMDLKTKTLSNGKNFDKTTKITEFGKVNDEFEFPKKKSVSKDLERIRIDESVSGPQLTKDLYRSDKSRYEKQEKEATKIRKLSTVVKEINFGKEKRNIERLKDDLVNKRREKNMKEKLEVSKEKVIRAKLENHSGKNHEDTVIGKHRRFMNKIVSSKISSSRELPSKISPRKENVSKTENARGYNYVKVQKSEIPRKIDDVIARKDRKEKNTAGTFEHRILVSGKKELLSLEDEVRIVGPVESESNTKIVREDLPILDKESEKGITLNSSKGSELSLSVVANVPTPEETHSQNMAHEISKTFDSIEDEAIIFNEDPEIEPQKTALDTSSKSHEGRFDNSHRKEDQIHELLTESELHLKQILLKSRLFLSTAEALFKLNIPFEEVFQETNYADQEDHERKVMLDCAYELMRRKGRRQELALYTSNKNIWNNSIEVTSFDDLVKQLHKDFEKLKVLAEDLTEELDIARCLNAMVNGDVLGREPEVNNMWDLGWNEMGFAVFEKYELIKEVESCLYDGVVDDVVKELLNYDYTSICVFS